MEPFLLGRCDSFFGHCWAGQLCLVARPTPQCPAAQASSRVTKAHLGYYSGTSRYGIRRYGRRTGIAELIHDSDGRVVRA